VLETSGATLVGLVAGDDVAMSLPAPAGAFDDPAVGVDKRVTVSGVALSGPDVWRYILVQPTTTADITPKATLTVLGVVANNKTYDGTTVATLDTAGAVLNGVVPPDDVTLGVAAAAGSFPDPSAGAGKTVTTTGFILCGSDAGLYVLEQPLVTASIMQRLVTVSANAASKDYGDDDPTLSYRITSGTLVSEIVRGA
jgi:hypothetical protein